VRFNVSAPNWSGTREATMAELREFKQLTGGIDAGLIDPLPVPQQ
jgi:hypothetical protein